jgi:hypothetical protein
VTRIEVARLDFPVLRTQEDFEHGQLPETLLGMVDAASDAKRQGWLGPGPITRPAPLAAERQAQSLGVCLHLAW